MLKKTWIQFEKLDFSLKYVIKKHWVQICNYRLTLTSCTNRCVRESRRQGELRPGYQADIWPSPETSSEQAALLHAARCHCCRTLSGTLRSWHLTGRSTLKSQGEQGDSVPSCQPIVMISVKWCCFRCEHDM